MLMITQKSTELTNETKMPLKMTVKKCNILDLETHTD